MSESNTLSDVLDINESDDLDVTDDGDIILSQLKSQVKKRKGRGFSVNRNLQITLGDSDSSIGTSYSEETLPKKSCEGYILFVTNIHEEATEDDLQQKFSEYGIIKSIHLNLDRRTGFVKGYALIEYETYSEANSAREALTETKLLGKKIQVDWCFVQGPNKRQFYRRRLPNRRNY